MLSSSEKGRNRAEAVLPNSIAGWTMFFRIIFVLFAAFIAWAIYMANTGQPNIFIDFVKHTPYGDKVGHFFLMGILALLANLALGYRRLSLGRVSLWLGSLLVLAFVVTEELTQIYIPRRTFDLGDLAADFIGIALFSWLGYRFICLARENGCGLS